MNLALWIAAILLTLVALTGGITKSFVPKQKLATIHGAEWTAGFGANAIRALGATELLAALGLILPRALGIAPVVVPVTATCWIALMVGAMITHSRLDQYKLVAVNVVYLAIAAFIAVGRY
ncbi:DoxX family protein [Streptomyces sp. NPDC048277]|uniref:DoxX family protein n=1 Tax=Streptomyces sp. NPDC048277 TaxID=3155027 RepID=UPI0033F766F4